ncbi:unnamed protein product [Lactuca saligna]|uniref:Disease resistance protein winged helix domain-containing protein n=1 Tax=Lactuca saligna TaxID=75948 RepID=A0AA36E0A6_LACSI|nr:unnamed protein product [Lactuca saligna]
MYFRSTSQKGITDEAVKLWLNGLHQQQGNSKRKCNLGLTMVIRRALDYVSDEFKIFNVSKVMDQLVTEENKEFADLNLLEEMLKEKLVKKCFLMVLDDLFAYCPLFPKDYKFDKEELVLLWMAEGFLQQQSRSFFLYASNDRLLFVMHDLINDLATSVAGDFFSRLGIEIKKEIRKEALEKYLHMSFVCEDYMVYKRFEAFKRAKSLRTFLEVSFEVKENWETFYLSNKILTDLLHELPLLRVLNLSHLSINEKGVIEEATIGPLSPAITQVGWNDKVIVKTQLLLESVGYFNGRA